MPGGILIPEYDCCPLVWWCTASGSVSTAVGDDPPTGFTSGPYRSQQRADEACPPTPPDIEPSDCPGRVCSAPLPNEYMYMDVDIFTGCAAGYSMVGLLATPVYIWENGFQCVAGYGVFVNLPMSPEGCNWRFTVEVLPLDETSTAATPTYLTSAGIGFWWGLGDCSCGAAINETYSISGISGAGGVTACEPPDCDAFGFSGQAFTFGNIASTGRFRLYRTDVAPPPYC